MSADVHKFIIWNPLTAFFGKGVLSHGFRVCLVALHVALKKSMVKSWISLISFFKQV